MHEITVDGETTGATLAAVLRHADPTLPWSRARALCERGKVRVNGELGRDPAYRVRAGDRVVVDERARVTPRDSLTDEQVLHVDRELIVVSKPSQLLSVPFDDASTDTLIDRAHAFLRARHGGQGAELGAVQRLDKDTTGVLVFARTLGAKRELQRQFRAHSIERRYLAIAHGALTTARTLSSDLLPDRGDGLRGSYGHFRRPRGPLPPQAQHAITHLTPRELLAGASLVECRLETGRQHQIRIHLSELGHPLVGEQVYIRDYGATRIEAPRPMLHAAVLGFEHPADGRPMRFELAPPPDFTRLLTALRRRTPAQPA